MTSIKNIALAALIAIIFLCSFSVIIKDKKNVKSVDSIRNQGFAIVELFTSEGCSSCPPADELAARIQKETTGQPVYILAFHVDYWNRLGWKDQFSNASFSKRQNQYAKWLNADIYTPQAIVNGRIAFVGSEEGTLRNAIKSSFDKKSSSELLLKDIKKVQNNVSVKYLITGETDKTSVGLALVQKSAISKVSKGENSGRTLNHVQIVRNFQVINLDVSKSGSANIDLGNLNLIGDWEIIAFLQKNSSGEIIAATKSVLDAGSPAAQPVK